MDSFKETLAWVICIILSVSIFLGLIAFIDVYTSTLKQECRLAAIEQNYNAVEIQAICERKQ